MKKVYIHGSFMNDNYGDFLLYYTIVDEAKKLNKDVKLISADVSDTYDQYIEVNRNSKWNSLRECDAAILSGGGYFSEPPTNKLFWNIRFLLKHGLPLLSLSLVKKPYAILGVGAGPESYSLVKWVSKKIFNNAKYLSVRDIESKDYLESIGVKNEISVVPDWVMAMDESELLSEKNKISDILSEFIYSEAIYIHLTTKNNDEDSGLELVLKDIEKYGKENPNCLFIIGCDQKRDTQEERAKEIEKRLSSNQTLFFPYQGPWVLSSMLGSVDKVITDKLHVGIVSTKLNKNVISTAYHTKTLRFYNQMGLSKKTRLLTDVSEGDVYNLLNEEFSGVIGLEEKVLEAKQNHYYLSEFINSLH